MKVVFSLWLLTTTIRTVHALNQVYELHGSGTSNPSKCYWSIMETLKEQSDVPLHMTYRAVGSTQGIKEFTAQFDGSSTKTIVPVFGSGDIPLSSADYALTKPNGATISQMYHLPVLIGAISFFHSVPNYDNLKLNACLLSQIFQLVITKWGDAAILALNPDMPTEARNLNIIVARRAEGSSSTYSSAEFMNEQCADANDKLPIELVVNLPAWKTSGQTRVCSKSAGMTSCIQAEMGVIGYIDAGHGQSAGLPEVLLQSKGSFTKSSTDLIQSAVTLADLPASADDDFSAVSFVTDGSKGWPIVNLTYLYVRKTISSYITDATEQAVLIAFLRALYSEEYVPQCAEKYGFVLPTPDIRDYALGAIAQVATGVSEFYYEADVITIDAANRRNVFSTHRAEIADIEREELLDDVKDIQGKLSSEFDGVLKDIAILKEEISALTSKNVQLQKVVDSVESGDFGSQEQNNLKGALALSILSFLAWIVWVGMYFFVGGGKQQNSITTGSEYNNGDLELKNNRFIEDETTRI